LFQMKKMQEQENVQVIELIFRLQQLQIK